MTSSQAIILFLSSLLLVQSIQNKTVLLMGDSLIGRPWREHNLQSYIQDEVQNIDLMYSANNGEKIESLNSRSQQTLDQYKPWAVILYWDSDCSDVNESELSEQEVGVIRDNFKLNLDQFIKTVQQSGALLAVAGPGLLGEGWLGLQDRFKNKTQMLVDYQSIIISVSQSYNVPYIDIREAYLQAIPRWWILYSQWVTVDGEHPNDRGTQIEASLFANQINQWNQQHLLDM